MEILPSKETLVICPYNSSHHIRKYRMEGHLVKCRRNYSDSEIVTCDFNATHEVPQPELAYHHQYCADRKFAELAIFQETDTPSSSKFIRSPVNFANFPMEEWEDDVENSYDPENYCVKNEILRKVDVQSAAKRRSFRLMERKRINHLKKSKEKEEEQEIENIESEKSYICEMMEKLSTGPLRAVIPKISIKHEVSPDGSSEDDYLKLIVKKTN